LIFPTSFVLARTLVPGSGVRSLFVVFWLRWLFRETLKKKKQKQNNKTSVGPPSISIATSNAPTKYV